MRLVATQKRAVWYSMAMSVSIDPSKIDELLTRGVSEVIQEASLRQKLESGRQLRVKLGIDPTSPNLHIGRSIPLLKLRDFQELGHQIVLIVGDATGVIGDTSDKDSERPMLTDETVAENMKNYAEQAGKLLDMNKVEVRHNSEWLGKLTYREIGEHATLFSVADFIARDNIRRRLSVGQRVSLRELLYPLMQGYDSVAVKADVELGGMDQKFNVLAGRPLQEHFGQKPQDVILGPLINGLDGKKMSSSQGNTINFTADPDDMYGKVMSLTDDEILNYFTICTRVPMAEVAEVEKRLAAEDNPRDLKMQLARALVTLYHGEKEAFTAETKFVSTFQQGNLPEDLTEIKAPYIDNLIASGVVASKSELRRLLEAGAVNDLESENKLEEIPESLKQPLILKVGKRRFVKLIP